MSKPFYTAMAVWLGLWSISPHVHLPMLDGAFQNLMAVAAAIFAGFAMRSDG